MSRAFATFVLASTLSGAMALAQEPAEPLLQESQVKTVEDLVTYVQQRERAVESVSMAMDSVGHFPDGSEFRTQGTLRVLGTTHFHATMKAQFGDQMAAETETVRTPEGIFMREVDPVQGEIYLRMDRALMDRVDSAAKALGDDAEIGGFGAQQARSPLGSAMLEDLSRQFELTVREPTLIDGQRCWVVGGPLKSGLTDEDEPFGLGADQVDVLVRTGDGAVIKMTQIRQGAPLLEVRITGLEFDRPFDPASFTLSVPPKGQMIDIMEHPPARAQIERMFEEAREKGWVDPGSGGETRDGEGRG